MHESDLKARWRRQGVQETEEGEGASVEKALDIVENSQNAGKRSKFGELPVDCS